MPCFHWPTVAISFLPSGVISRRHTAARRGDYAGEGAGFQVPYNDGLDHVFVQKERLAVIRKLEADRCQWGLERLATNFFQCLEVPRFDARPGDLAGVFLSENIRRFPIGGGKDCRIAIQLGYGLGVGGFGIKHAKKFFSFSAMP